MPGVDIPMQELEAYRGSHPAPNDFIEFWREQKKKRNVSKIKVQTVEQNISNHEIICRRFTATLEDGTELSAKYIKPSRKETCPILVHFHDYPMASRSWFHLSRYAAIGYSVLAPDCRGQGGESGSGSCGKGPTAYGPMFYGMEDTVENMYLYRLYMDAFTWVDLAKEFEQTDKNDISVYGEGQGAALAIASAGMEQDIQLCVAHYPMLCDYKRVWMKDFDCNGYEGLKYYFRWHDPLHEREEEIFDKLAYVDVKNFAPYVRASVLMSTGLQDIVSPPSAQYAVYNSLRCEKLHKVYPKHGHELNNFFENEALKFLVEGRLP
ncbi:MAG: acetylxylan esterase [Roseburia sp.]